MKKTKALKTLAIALPALIVPSSAFAGKMTPEPNATNPTVVHVQTTVHIAFPPTAQDIIDITRKLKQASRMVCDATEGMVLIDDIRLERNGLSAETADVYWYAKDTLNQQSCTGETYFGENQVRVDNDVSFRTVGHELSHCLFGLRDQYFRQRYGSDGCGLGPSIEQADISPTNHTIMQDYSSLCAPSGALDAPLSPEIYCNRDADCPMFSECSEFSPLASEFSRATTWESTLGDAINYPGPLPGEKLWLSTRIYSNMAATWTKAQRYSKYLEDVRPSTGFYPKRSIEYIDELGELNAGSSHQIWLRARLPDKAVAPEIYEIQAAIGPTDTAFDNPARILTWRVNGTPASTLTLEFNPMATGCGPDPTDVANTGLATINSLAAPSVTLEISSAQLQLDNSSYGTTDVSLDVGMDEVCKRSGTSAYFHVLDEEFSWETGEGSGTYIGRSDPGNQGGGLSSEPVYQQLGKCNNRANERWLAERQLWANSNQYEYWLAKCPNCPANGSDFSDAATILYNLSTKWPQMTGSTFQAINLSLPAVTASPGNCVGFDPPVSDEKIDTVDTVAILIDRSKSMMASWNYLGDEQRRIDWARAGAVGFAAAGQTASIPMHVSFASFNHEQPDLGPNMGLLTPNPPPGVSANDIRAMATLTPMGSTAIGDAVIFAINQMFPDPQAANAVFLLTDGENKKGAPITGPGSASEASINAQIPVFVSPVGDFLASDSNIEDLANSSGGQVLAPPTPDAIPATMFEVRSRLRGEDPSLVYAESSLVYGDPAKNYPIYVEEGADRLLFLVTPSDPSKITWTPDFTLTGPMGESITEIDSGNVTTDSEGYFQLISVSEPSGGEWTMTLHPPPTVSDPVRNQLVMAHIEHATREAPRCRVSASHGKVTDDAEAVVVRVEADWMGLVGVGATFTAEVRRPDGSLSPLSLIQQADGVAEGSFAAYSHDGVYQIRVHCAVPDTAIYAVGEPEEPAQQVEDLLVPGAFERVGLDYFVVTAGLAVFGEGQTCLPSVPQHDQDGDGRPDLCDDDDDGDDLPDSMEGAGDTDADGVPDNGDHDSDNDGDSDANDWDPTDPTAYRRYSFGDFNGDGNEDVAWGEPDASSGRGQVMVRIAGESQPETWSQNTPGVLDVSESGDAFGAAIAVGDFDGDGYDDLAVGVPGEDFDALSDPGAVNVLYGSATGLSGIGDQFWKEGYAGLQGTAESGDGLGARLSIGDFNCDGFDDLVIGTPDEAIGANAEAGAVHVLYGSAGGLTSVSDLWYQGNSGVNGSSEAGDRFGDTLISADFNGDSCTDLVIGAPTEDWAGAADAGNAYAMYGSATGLTTTGDWTIVQGVIAHVVGTNDRFGTRMWTEDRNEDNYDDLIVMTPGDPCGATNKGFNYLYGGAAGLSTSGEAWICREYHD